MTSRKTKVILTAMLYAMLITETGATIALKHQLANKTTESKALDVEINTLIKQQKQYEDYINTNKELINDAQNTKKKDEELTKQNEELQKMNDMLKRYKETVSPQTYSRGGSSFAQEKKLTIKKIIVELSAYGKTGNKTASGVWPQFGMVAAPDEIPFGSGLIMDGYFDNRVFTVTDRGGYIKKVGDTYRIDIYMNVPDSQLRAFGRHRSVTAYLIEQQDS